MSASQEKPIHPEKVNSKLQDQNIEHLHFETINSTNTWAKLNANTFNPDKITYITADVQTAGRGRFNRVWVSPKGKNILVTFFFTLPKQSPLLSFVGEVLGLSCASLLERQGFSPKIKWPNDILLEGKKVAGILGESVTLDHYIGVVVGIGVNVNMEQESLDTVGQPATSLAVLTGRTFSVQELLEHLVHQYTADLAILKEKGFSPFHRHFDRLLAYKGTTITCRIGSTSVTGICKEVDLEGRLHLELPSGHIEKISSGEIV